MNGYHLLPRPNGLDAIGFVKISVVIPVINEATLIVDSVDRAWNAGCDQVVVVDGGSSDGTAELAGSHNCLLISSPMGRGIQMNSGARSTTGEVILFLHVDNWLEKDACQQVRTALTQNASGWGGFHQRIESDQQRFRWLEKGNALRVGWQGLVYGDQGLFVTKDLFEHVDGFPDQPLMEDFEISRRLTKIRRPLLLPGPIHVDPRRWQRNGVIHQTFRNWSLAMAYRCGQSPESLVKKYRRHDQC